MCLFWVEFGGVAPKRCCAGGRQRYIRRMKKTGIFDSQGGFTLVEAMVTVAVLVILATIAVPGLQAFVTRSGMNAIRDEFSIALQRARLDAISRNTCVSICQLADGKTDACVVKARDGWHEGWIVYANDSCAAVLPTAAIASTHVIAVRQASDPRFQLIQPSASGLVTFDARGTQIGQIFSGFTRDTQYTKAGGNPLARKITVTLQGRVGVAKHEPKASSGGA